MHLSDFMDANGFRDEQVAAAIDVSRATVSRIRRRKARPDWQTIQKLREWSGNRITADDFERLDEESAA